MILGQISVDFVYYCLVMHVILMSIKSDFPSDVINLFHGTNTYRESKFLLKKEKI